MRKNLNCFQEKKKWTMKLCFKKQTSGAEEVDQWLRACAAVKRTQV